MLMILNGQDYIHTLKPQEITTVSSPCYIIDYEDFVIEELSPADLVNCARSGIKIINADIATTGYKMKTAYGLQSNAAFISNYKANFTASDDGFVIRFAGVPVILSIKELPDGPILTINNRETLLFEQQNFVMKTDMRCEYYYCVGNYCVVYVGIYFDNVLTTVIGFIYDMQVNRMVDIFQESGLSCVRVLMLCMTSSPTLRASLRVGKLGY